MSKVFVGGITSTGERLLTSYLDKFEPSAEIEPLKASGVRGRIKNQARRPDVILVIIDESLYNECLEVAGDVLKLPKVHKYVDDEGLKQFLISKFGELPNSGGTVEVKEEVVEDSVATLVDSPVDFEATPIAHSSTDTDEVERLRAELAQSEMMVRNLTNQLKEGCSGSDTKDFVKQIKVLKNQLAEKEKTIIELEEKQYASLGKVTKAEETINEVKNLRGQLQEKSEELSKAQYKVTDLDTRCISLSEDNTHLQEEVASLKESIGTLATYQEQYTALRAEFDGQADNLKTLESRYATLEKEYSADVTAHEDKVKELNEKYDDLEADLDAEREISDGLRIKNDTLGKRVGELSAEVEDLTNQLETASGGTRSYEERVTELQAEVAKQEAELKMYQNLQSQYDELVEGDWKAKYDALKGEAWETKYKSLKEDYDRVLKESNTTPLRKQITSLEAQVSELTSKLEDTTDSDEYKALRDRYTELELSFADKEEEIKELSSSIFSQMYECSMPKVKLATIVGVSKGAKNISVIASTSTESNLSLYRSLRRACEADKKNNILVLDLSVDTYVDVEFRTQGIKTPIPWLFGSEPIKNFMSSTELPNVKVISTGLAYINPLALLRVDWNVCLEELSTVADKVIINVGCLNSVVSKILFQSLATVVNSALVAKATPVNLRTTILTLAGMKGIQNSNVYCVNFDNASKAVYQQLASKYRTQILGANDVMVL